MKTTSIFLLCVLVSVFLFSCTIQKRMFNKGYHIEWNKKFERSTKDGNEAVKLEADEVSSESNKEQIIEVGTTDPELFSDTCSILISDGAMDSYREIESDEFSNAENIKEKTTIHKSIQKKRNKTLIYNRGDGGNVLLGLCTLVMICLCMAMISAFMYGELSLAGIILIFCFGWILIVFTLILIVLFIVRFIRNF